jgi:hypothetical protein
MNKEQLELLSDAYKRYADSHKTPGNPNGKTFLEQLDSVKPMQHSKETFIEAIKTNDEFAKQWGVVYEERDLSLDERVKLTVGTEQYRNYSEEQWKDYIETTSIPTRAISITYNNETIESYE